MKPKVTKFVDKMGKPIHVDDILQHRLGTFGKSAGRGASTSRVVRFGKHIRQVDADGKEHTSGGLPLTAQYCNRAVISEHAY